MSRAFRFIGFYLASFIWFNCTLVLAILIHQARYRIPAGLGMMAAVALVWAVTSWVLYRRRRAWFTKSFLLAWLGTVAVVYAVAMVTLYFVQDRLLFVPIPGKFGSCPQFADEGGADFEAVDLHQGAEHIRAYARVRPGARAWVIMFHGNAESACAGENYAHELGDLSVNFLSPEYPGYVGDSGPQSQAAFLRNAEAVYDYAVRRAALPVVSFGRSLGTGIATYVASVRPVEALILISPYTSIVDVGAYQYPFFPVRWVERNPFPAASWAPAVHAPVLILHGTQDRVIPIAIGRELAAQFSPPAKMVEFPGITHGTIVHEEAPTWAEIRAFLAKVI